VNIKKNISIRVYLVYIGLVLWVGALIFKIVLTQQVHGGYWKSVADSLTTDYKKIEAERGNIYSEDGRLLATSLPFFELRMDTKAESVSSELFRAKSDSLALCLSKLFNDKSVEDYRRLIVNGRKDKERYLLLKRRVSYTDLLVVRKFPIFNLGRYKGGLIAIQQPRRVNPFDYVALRTIGLCRDGAQKVGLEAKYDNYLQGTNGRQLMQRITGNTWLPLTDENAIEPQNGKDIVTTIDVGLQDVAENALLNTLIKNEAKHGCAILMEVKTGKIKALANLGQDESGAYSENFNYAIAEAIEPGSTFKMASCAALIESGLADTSTMVDLEHGHKLYGKQKMTDHELAVNYVSLKTSFAISSNVGISKLVTTYFGSNPQKYFDLLKQFGLTEKTGIDLDGEARPDVKNTSSKYYNKVVSLPWMSVGYEERLTPLQTLCWYNTIANNGKRMKPYLVSQVKEFGKVIKQFEPTIVKENVVKPATVGKLRAIMEAVVTKGTAKGVLLNPNYSIGGKTGTAQIFQLGSGGFNNKGGGSKKFLASFVGYFPADNPLYSCIVVIYNPTKDKSVYYGSQVACPVFKELADKVYATSTFMHSAIEKNDSLLHPNDRPSELVGNSKEVELVLTELKSKHATASEIGWCSMLKNGNSYSSVNRNIEQGKVPDVSGFSLKDALFVLENKGLKVKFTGNGKVISQNPDAGEILIKGSEISLELSN
jgi:cell division protein FtsI (penicillin-binding protein 3)